MNSKQCLIYIFLLSLLPFLPPFFSPIKFNIWIGEAFACNALSQYWLLCRSDEIQRHYPCIRWWQLGSKRVKSRLNARRRIHHVTMADAFPFLRGWIERSDLLLLVFPFVRCSNVCLTKCFMRKSWMQNKVLYSAHLHQNVTNFCLLHLHICLPKPKRGFHFSCCFQTAIQWLRDAIPPKSRACRSPIPKSQSWNQKSDPGNPQF